MSKLVSGDAKIDDLSVVVEAAHILGWVVEYGVAVSYFEGPGPVCDVVVRPSDNEQDRFGQSVGRKYTIGYTQDAHTRRVTIFHDNAMDGGAVFSVEGGQQDETTKRIIGKLQQTIATVELKQIYKEFRASWRTMLRADGAQVHIIKRN